MIFHFDFMRILAKGETKKECQNNADRLTARGWTQITEPKIDESYIGVRWVAVMQQPDLPHKKRKFNKYMGY
jgi:hypothetical protein